MLLLFSGREDLIIIDATELNGGIYYGSLGRVIIKFILDLRMLL